jgi:hypothetical protein
VQQELAAMTEPIVLQTSISDFEQSTTLWEAINAVCEELGLDARNSLSREIVAREVIECARLEGDPERICEMVVQELKGPTLA